MSEAKIGLRYDAIILRESQFCPVIVTLSGKEIYPIVLGQRQDDVKPNLKTPVTLFLIV